MDRHHDIGMKKTALDHVGEVVAGQRKAGAASPAARAIIKASSSDEIKELIEPPKTQHSQFRHRPSSGVIRRARSA